jgi:DNA-binding transcriptional ArsR family regulator
VTRLNETFKALSDPTRRAILDLLKERDKTAGEIAEHFHITKPSVSHHLSGLKNANLVQDERRGQFIYYSLNTTVLQDVMKWLLDVSNKTEGKDEQ